MVIQHMSPGVEARGAPRTHANAQSPRQGYRARGGSQTERSSRAQGNPLARGLGWFSIGLGLTEAVAPRWLARAIGMQDHRALLRVFGLREIAAGLGILTQRAPVGWMWGRVGGDAMDLSVLALALASNRSRRGRVAAATVAVAGVTVLDVLCSRQLSEQSGMTTEGGAIRAHKSMTIDRSPEDLYRVWRDIGNLPRWMNHLQSVRVTGENRSHWVVKAPAGTTVEWDAEITEDRPNERIAWRSLPGGAVDHSGSVRFERAPGGRGTEMHMELAYRSPGGLLGAAVAKLFGQAPGQHIQEDMRRFKQAMEAGEAATTNGQSRGT